MAYSFSMYGWPELKPADEEKGIFPTKEGPVEAMSVGPGVSLAGFAMKTRNHSNPPLRIPTRSARLVRAVIISCADGKRCVAEYAHCAACIKRLEFHRLWSFNGRTACTSY